MVRCFKCNNSFDLSLYFMHLKKYHKLDTEDTYCCNENDCKQTFSLIKSYKKHVNKFHNLYINNLETNEVKQKNVNELHKNNEEFCTQYQNIIDNIDEIKKTQIDLPEIVKNMIKFYYLIYHCIRN